MATKKKANKAKRKGGSKKKRNQQKSASSQSSSAKATSTAKKANPKKKKGGRKLRNPKSVMNNPLAALGNVSLQEWGAFALAAIASPTLASLIATPGGWLNIGIQFGFTALAAKVAPRSVKTAAVFGAGGPAVVSLVNKLTSNAIPNAITRYVGPIIPAGLLGTATVAQTQMAGVPRFVRV